MTAVLSARRSSPAMTTAGPARQSSPATITAAAGAGAAAEGTAADGAGRDAGQRALGRFAVRRALPDRLRRRPPTVVKASPPVFGRLRVRARERSGLSGYAAPQGRGALGLGFALRPPLR